MLDSVPTGTVSLSLPATTIRRVWPGLPQTSWEPALPQHLPTSDSQSRTHLTVLLRHRLDATGHYGRAGSEALARESVYH
jgi:hypothetical protein